MEKSIQESVINICSKRGIVYPSAEIYSSMAGIFSYGPVGHLIKENIKNLWIEKFIRSENNVFQISSSTLLPHSALKASGHLDTFNDPLVQCLNNKCNSNYRLDHLLEGLSDGSLEGKSATSLAEIMKNKGIKCPRCSGELGEAREFNLMFGTNIGPTKEKKAYLRPETAQNMFLDFRKISHSMRLKLPFGIAQIGKAYRNEISPRNFLIRMREFEQLEIEMFVDEDEINSHPRWNEIADIKIRLLTKDAQVNGGEIVEIKISEAVRLNLIKNQYLAYYLSLETQFLIDLGIPKDQFWFRELLEHQVAHYSKANYDLEVQFENLTIECVGNSYRADYDLKKHMEHSNQKKMHIDINGKKVVPHVIEPSFGLDRLFYITLMAAYRNTDRKWDWLKLPNSITPWEAKICPLMKKEELKGYATELFWDLKDAGVEVVYDETGAIGKRYARADEIGIPYVLTVDYQTLEKGDLTIRDRDTTKQVRVKATAVSLAQIIRDLIFNIITWEDIE